MTIKVYIYFLQVPISAMGVFGSSLFVFRTYAITLRKNNKIVIDSAHIMKMKDESCNLGNLFNLLV